MKKLFILTMCVIALGSCNDGVKKAEEAAQQQRDSLEQIITQKDNEINDMMTTLSDIEEGFREITEAQNRAATTHRPLAAPEDMHASSTPRQRYRRH